MGYVEYDSNNSGGSWWLDDQNWRDLEAAGWQVVWAGLSPKFNEDGGYERDPETGVPIIVPAAESGSKYGLMSLGVKEGRYLGALARSAYRAGLSLHEAVAEWEGITAQSASETGCPCCGTPHNFTEYGATGEWLRSGPEVSYSASFA